MRHWLGWRARATVHKKWPGRRAAGVDRQQRRGHVLSHAAHVTCHSNAGKSRRRRHPPTYPNQRQPHQPASPTPSTQHRHPAMSTIRNAVAKNATSVPAFMERFSEAYKRAAGYRKYGGYRSLLDKPNKQDSSGFVAGRPPASHAISSTSLARSRRVACLAGGQETATGTGDKTSHRPAPPAVAVSLRRWFFITTML